MEHEQQRRGCVERRRVRVCGRFGDRRELGRCRTCVDSTDTGRDGGCWDVVELRGMSVFCSMMMTIGVLGKDPRNGGKPTVVALPFSKLLVTERKRKRERLGRFYGRV